MDGTEVYDASRPCFSICLVDGSYSMKMFFDTDDAMICFILQSVLDMIEVLGSKKTIAGDVVYATN